MDRNFARALPLVLSHEGGYSNHPMDKGGPTNKGVTLATFRAYVKPGGTVADLKAITDEQVATVYYRHYWAAVNAQALPSGVDYAVFDFAVNSGPSRAAKYLQAILGVEQDGRVGPKTIAAANAKDARAVINGLCDARLAFLKRITSGGKLLWDTFGKGWDRRVSDVRRDALLMVGHPADVKQVIKEIPVVKPTVPPAVEQEVQSKTGMWSWLTGLIGSGGLGLGWLVGMDWQAILAGGAVLVVMLLIILLLRRQIVGAVKEIREGLA